MWTDPNQLNSLAAPESEDRRLLTRNNSNAQATIFRESDVIRQGIQAMLTNLSTLGVGLTTSDAPPDLNETVKIRLENPIQRFKKEIRGFVRHVTALDDGGFNVGIELMTRLTPLDVSLLKIGCSNCISSDEPVWV